MREGTTKIKIKEAVIVEGKYDKITLSDFLDATIIETNGFQIYKDEEKLSMIRTLADKNGIVVLTDSDSAGFQIRGYLSQCIPKEKIKHAYIPDILGKETRKSEVSKEGKLGVEGMKREILLEALKKAGVFPNEEKKSGREIVLADFYEDSLIGKENSSFLREKLILSLGLPQKLSTKSLLRVLNEAYGYETYQKKLEEIVKQAK